MIVECWFELLAKVIRIAQRDAQSKDPSKRRDAQAFLSIFLEGVTSDGI